MCCANGEHGVRYSASDSQPPPEAASVSPRVMRGTNFVNLCSTRPIQLAFAAALVCAVAVAQQPRIDSLVPSQGPIAGGTLVSIRGTNFTDASSVLALAASGLRQWNIHETGRETVPMERLDDYVSAAGLPEPSLIKLD